MSNASNVEPSVKSYILNEFLPGEDPAQLTDSTPLMTAGILDSIATLKLVLFLEQQFSSTIDAYESDSEHVDTIDRIVKLVQSKG